MRCAACDADNPGDAKFCESCGSSLAIRCPRCSHANRAGSRFCTECGAQLAAAVPALKRDAAPRAVPPSSYTPPHLARKILASRA
jgi:hypothetical protein